MEMAEASCVKETTSEKRTVTEACSSVMSVRPLLRRSMMVSGRILRSRTMLAFASCSIFHSVRSFSWFSMRSRNSSRFTGLVT